MVNRNKNGKAQTVMRSRRAEIWPAVGEGAVTIPPAFNSACDAEVLARSAHAQHGVRGLTTKERSWKVALLPRYQCLGINARVSMPGYQCQGINASLGCPEPPFTRRSVSP